MNADELADAQAISDELGLDIRIQTTELDGEFRLLVLDRLHGPWTTEHYAEFVERYGTLESVRAEIEEHTAAVEMDEPTIADLTARTLEIVASFRGHEVAPQSALPDSVDRVRHALQASYIDASEPERERAIMNALVDLEAFIPDGLIPAPGDRVSEDIRGIVREDQTAAVVFATGVNGWRADDGLPAEIGDAERAIRVAVASQAGYNASGVPAMFVALVSVAVVGVVALVITIASNMSLLAAAVAGAASALGAVGVLGPASRLASANAAAAWLDRATPSGQRARRVMSLVEWLPAIGAIAGGVIGLTAGAVLLG
jgi:hypothetical protein